MKKALSKFIKFTAVLILLAVAVYFIMALTLRYSDTIITWPIFGWVYNLIDKAKNIINSSLQIV